MEILFISHKYPPTIGGMEKQSYELIKEVSKRHNVHKLTYNAKEEKKTSFVIKLRRRVGEILNKNPNIDIIHLNDGAMGMFATWLKKRTNIPIVVTFHGLDIVFPNPIYQNKIVNKLKKFDGFICVSEATAYECKKRGFAPEKTYVVANGVDPELARIPIHLNGVGTKIKTKFNTKNIQDKKIIVSLGRMTKRKGFTWFLENIVPELDDDTVFILIGPDPNKREAFWKKVLPQKLTHEVELALGAVDESHLLNETVNKAAIENKVFLAGQLPFGDVMSLLSLAHLFVMPNIKIYGDAEGFGLVALEASVRGTTVLASGIEGITQAIQHNKNGILLPSRDKTAWLNCIKEQLSDLEKLEEQSQRFKAFTLENYTWQKMAEGYISVFEQIVQKKNTEKV